MKMPMRSPQLTAKGMAVGMKVIAVAEAAGLGFQVVVELGVNGKFLLRVGDDASGA